MFGAYTHCKWPVADSVVADPTGMSFLFSLLNGGARHKPRSQSAAEFCRYGSPTSIIIVYLLPSSSPSCSPWTCARAVLVATRTDSRSTSKPALSCCRSTGTRSTRSRTSSNSASSRSRSIASSDPTLAFCFNQFRVNI